jgi:hypothetical protein
VSVEPNKIWQQFACRNGFPRVSPARNAKKRQCLQLILASASSVDFQTAAANAGENWFNLANLCKRIQLWKSRE